MQHIENNVQMAKGYAPTVHCKKFWIVGKMQIWLFGCLFVTIVA